MAYSGVASAYLTVNNPDNVSLEAIPEPGSAALLLLGATLFNRRRR